MECLWLKKMKTICYSRKCFPTEDLPEYVFVQHVYIDKFNGLKFRKYGFDNFEVDELITGECKFDVFEDPLLTE